MIQKKIKIQKNLEIIKDTYEMLIDLKKESISSPLGENFLQKIQAGNYALLKNRINLTKGLVESTKNILDYFSEILTDFNKKDMKREKKLFDSFISEYEKI